jgi:hypothetical protein
MTTMEEILPFVEVACGNDAIRDEMDQEDWLRPLKLSGGRLALRAEFLSGRVQEWFWLDNQSNLMVSSPFDLAARRIPPSRIGATLDSKRATLRPVTAEDVPERARNDG